MQSEMTCAACEEKEAVEKGFCPCCLDIYNAIEANGGPISFKECVEICDSHGLLTDSQRKEWLEESRIFTVTPD